MGQREESIVRNFISAFEHSWPADMDAALAPLSADAYYQIAVPTFPPIQGRDHIAADLRAMQVKVTEQKHDMLRVGSGDGAVFTERVDYSKRNGTWTSIPLVAIFEVNEAGEITAWREYLDLANTAYQHGMTVEQLRESLGLPVA